MPYVPPPLRGKTAEPAAAAATPGRRLGDIAGPGRSLGRDEGPARNFGGAPAPGPAAGRFGQTAAGPEDHAENERRLAEMSAKYSGPGGGGGGGGDRGDRGGGGCKGGFGGLPPERLSNSRQVSLWQGYVPS